MIQTNFFSSSENAAENITQLWQFLNKDHENHKYIYRGQVKEFPGPLLPSMYRPFFSEKDTSIDNTHPLIKFSLKKCGKKFYGDHNFQIHNSVASLYTKFSEEQIEGVRSIFGKVMNSPNIAQLQVNKRQNGRLSSWFELVEASFNDYEEKIYSQHIDEWKPIIDRYHKRCIRIFFFEFIFGYTFGNLLSQQYGLNSGCLDATTDLNVAVFFATHDSKNDYLTPQKNGIGIIYRFPYEPFQLRSKHSEYYSMPGSIDLTTILIEHGCPGNNTDDLASKNTDDIVRLFHDHGMEVYQTGEHNAVNWHFPKGALQLTRFWNQASAIILPDELRKDLPKNKSGVAGITAPAFQYIEDLSTREGIEKFYFRHTGELPPGFTLNREYIWPRKDPFISIISSGMTAVYPIRRFLPHVIPYRLDLIDAGFGKEEFNILCKEKALNYPVIFSDVDEELEEELRLAEMMGTRVFRLY